MSIPKISRRQMREAALQVLFCQAFTDPELARSVAAVETNRTVDQLRQSLTSLNEARTAIDSASRAIDSAIQGLAERIKPADERKEVKHTDPTFSTRVEYADQRKATINQLKDTIRLLESHDELFSEKSFTMKLLRSYRKHELRVSSILEKCLEGWTLRRLTAEDSAALRLGITELIYFPDVPPLVIVTEYLELAKMYGDNESTKIINAVLDRVMKEYPREKTQAAGE